MSVEELLRKVLSAEDRDGSGLKVLVEGAQVLVEEVQMLQKEAYLQGWKAGYNQGYADGSDGGPGA